MNTPDPSPTEVEDEPVKPVLAPRDCRQQLPAWGVTREFRFGQFIRLFDERKSADGKSMVTPLVLNADGDVVEPQPATESQAPPPIKAGSPGSNASESTSISPKQTSIRSVVLNEMPIAIWETENFEAALAGEIVTIGLSDPEELIASARFMSRGREYGVVLGPDSIAGLRAGQSVVAIATAADGARSVTRLQPAVARMDVASEQLDQILAARFVDSDEGAIPLNEYAIRSLMTSGSALVSTRTLEGVGRLVAINVTGQLSTGIPAASAFLVRDCADFIAAPVIPAADGSMIRVELDAASVASFRREGQLTTTVNGKQVLIGVLGRGYKPVPDGPDPGGPLNGDTIILGPAYVLRHKIVYGLDDVRRDELDTVATADGKNTGYNGTASATQGKPSVPAFSKIGLPIAVLLPWKQTWKLVGFTRGNLISSLALAPGEETRITVASWERRAKSLDQTAETDVEQTFDFTSTTRDTEDVFKEVVSSNDFHAQASASLDASYSPGVASITVHAEGEISNDQSLAVTARNSTQRVRESTSRAATKVRSRRITRITESLERSSTNEVIRTIRNPNQCSTLTLNFHEVLAHYDIDVEFNAAAVRLVVLIPNPEPTKVFTDLTARVNEATLRASLLDPALGDGFDACRLLSAYGYAEGEIRRLAGLAKEELDQDRVRTCEDSAGDLKPPNPHLAALVSILNDLKLRYAPFVAADSAAAYKSIASWVIPPPAAQVSSANRWLWKRLVLFKLGDGLITALDELSKVASVGPLDARRVVASAPGLGSTPALDTLGSLSEKEKEDAGLFASSSGALGGPWWWWYPRLKDSRLYDVADGGIPGLIAQLRTKLQDWETKEAEGAGLEQAEAALSRANSEQQKATVADRLEMKYGAEEIGSAYERREALLTHLNMHTDFYRFVLFQGMPPSEQLQRIIELAPQLKVGTFEPHVVASDGPNLAIPLTPIAETTIAKVVKNLTARMKQAADEALVAEGRIATDHVILATPGVSVESWLGECSGCEEHVEQIRSAERRLALADARIRELEGDRRAAMIEDDNLEHPGSNDLPVFHVKVD